MITIYGLKEEARLQLLADLGQNWFKTMRESEYKECRDLPLGGAGRGGVCPLCSIGCEGFQGGLLRRPRPDHREGRLPHCRGVRQV